MKRLAGVARLGLPAFAARAHQREPAGLGPRHRRREGHAQRGDGQAVRVLALALARELDLEGRPDAEVEPLLGDRRHAGGRHDALAPDEGHPGAVGKSLARLHDHDRSRGQVLAAGGDDGLAVLAGDDAGADPALHALDREVGVGEDRRLVGGRIQHEQERLLLVDPVGAGAREGRLLNGRAPGRERELAPAAHGRSVEGGEPGAQTEGAANAARHVAREVVRPLAAVDPAGRARLRALHVEHVGGRTRIAQRHHRRREPRGHLPDALDHALGAEADHVRRCSGLGASGQGGNEHDGHEDEGGEPERAQHGAL